MALAARVRPAAGEPEGALVLFHGRGADEHDLFPLLDALDPERRLQGYTPRGPLALPPGGAHWYVVPRVGFPDPESFQVGYTAAAEFLDALPFPAERTVIGGVSQGAGVSYALGPGEGRPRAGALLAPRGVVPPPRGGGGEWAGRLAGGGGRRRRALSLGGGVLPPPGGGGAPAPEPPSPPIAIVHGQFDPVISVEFAREARAKLEAAGAEPFYRELPI